MRRRRPTTRTSPRRWPRWPTSTSTTPSARRIGRTPRRRGSPTTCRPWRDCSWSARSARCRACWPSRRKPFHTVIGGAKVSGKLEVLESLLARCQAVLVGGGMANTFLAARGHRARQEPGRARAAGERRRASWPRRAASACASCCPTDVVVAAQIHPRSQRQVVAVEAVPKDWIVVDIGPQTVAAYTEHLAQGQDDLLEWTDGHLRDRPVRRGDQRDRPLPGRAQRRGGGDHRWRWRLGGGRRAAGPGGPDEPRQHRWRGVARVRGGQDSCPAWRRCSMRIRRRKPSRHHGPGHDQAAPRAAAKPWPRQRRVGGAKKSR